MDRKLITVALIGEPNAGKSTLTNALVGEKITIVTHKVQTTRENVRGVVTDGDTQMVLIDTPGLFDAKKTLEKFIVKNATASFEEADIVCLVIDINRLAKDAYKDVFVYLRSVKKPIFAIINKIDMLTNEEILHGIQKLSDEQLFKEIIPVSGLKNRNIDHLRTFLMKQAEPGPWIFEDDEITDQNNRKLAEEITREQAFLHLHEELPYSLKVETEKWEENEELIVIHQVIFVTKEAHKGIALGKGGSKIRTIGQAARIELTKLLGKRVNLFLFVKVREDWIERDFSQLV